MRVGQLAALVLVCAGAVVATDLLMGSSLLRLLRPRLLSPADGAIITGPVIVSWDGPHTMQATLTGSGQRIDLGFRESPFEIDAARFPRPGQYGIELRAKRFGSLIGADRRFMVRRARERSAAADADNALPGQPAATNPARPQPASNTETLRQVEAERDQLRSELAGARDQLMKLREDNADLGQALDELQDDTDARLAAADQQREELAREHLLALQENQFLRLRMDSIPPCTAWGYLSYPRPQTNPPSRIVLVSDRNGNVFRSEADCARIRRTDPGGGSACVCVGAVWAQ
jgi:hypothetical protein